MIDLLVALSFLAASAKRAAPQRLDPLLCLEAVAGSHLDFSVFSKYLSILAMNTRSRVVHGGFAPSTSILFASAFTSVGGTAGGPDHVGPQVQRVSFWRRLRTALHTFWCCFIRRNLQHYSHAACWPMSFHLRGEGAITLHSWDTSDTSGNQLCGHTREAWRIGAPHNTCTTPEAKRNRVSQSMIMAPEPWRKQALHREAIAHHTNLLFSQVCVSWACAASE